MMKSISVIYICVLTFLSVTILSCQTTNFDGLEENNEGQYLLKNGNYICDSTSNRSNQQLKFSVNQTRVNGTYDLDDMETNSWFTKPDTIQMTTGKFSGNYQLDYNGLKIYGTFDKNIDITTYDTLEIVSGYINSKGYLLDSMSYITDTILVENETFNSKYHLSENQERLFFQ